MIHDVESFDIQEYSDTHVRVHYDGTLVAVPLIDYNTLAKKSTSAVQALKREKARNQENFNLVTDLAQYKTYSLFNKTRAGSGRLADAMIVADSIRGMSLDEIKAKEYPYRKERVLYDSNGNKKVDKNYKKFGRDKIFSALSARKDEDGERLLSLFRDFPDVFEGISEEQLKSWAEKRGAHLDKWVHCGDRAKRLKEG